MEGRPETEVFPQSVDHNLCYCSWNSPPTYCHTSSVFYHSSSLDSAISIVLLFPFFL